MRSVICEIPSVREEAEIEGKRIFENNQKRNRPKDQIRPNELELDILGSMGELAVCEILKKKKRNFRRNKVDVDTPVKEADIIVDDSITIDVKAHQYYANEWHTNLKSFKDEKKEVKWYWFIKFITDTNVEYSIFTRQEVATWEIKKLKYTEALCKTINTDFTEQDITKRTEEIKSQ
jgi:hypothetical protein